METFGTNWKHVFRRKQEREHWNNDGNMGTKLGALEHGMGTWEHGMGTWSGNIGNRVGCECQRITPRHGTSINVTLCLVPRHTTLLRITYCTITYVTLNISSSDIRLFFHCIDVFRFVN